MRLLNLFDGIGGFGLAAKWMGWENVASCEIDPYCRRVLDYWFDYKYIYDNIKTTDFTPLRGNIDLVTGGFPCQPFSLAGKQLGENDERYLWPHMLRAIREVRPRWVVAENVRGLITQSDGMVFEQVCADLEAEGYEVQPFVLPAAGVGAPHRRDRLWIVAHRADAGIESEREREDGVRASINVADSLQRNDDNPFCIGGEKGDFYPGVIEEEQGEREPIPANRACSDSDSDRKRLQEQYISSKSREKERVCRRCERNNETRSSFDRFPTQSPICRRNDGLSDGLVGITFSTWVRQSLKMFGNSIVPQVAYQIFRAIEYYENRTH